MFYVYEITIVATGEVIYVGKGKGERYKAKKKNKLLNRLIQDNVCEFNKVSFYETEEEAFEAERQRINELKSVGQAICNKVVYSTGGVSRIWTEEKRAEMSLHNPMKEEHQRKRMSENNPMKNKKIAEQVAEKRRLRFVIDGKEYVGLDSASKEFGVTKQGILYWLNNGRTASGLECHKIKTETVEQYISKTEFTHTVIYDGVEYQSIKDACKVAGCKSNTMSRWLKRGYSPTGIECRFKDDLTEHIFVDLSSKNRRHRQVEVNGVVYESIVQASRHVGISAKNLNYYLLHAKNPPVKCRYVNQQPSHTKSGNSSVEGSTTNG